MGGGRLVTGLPVASHAALAPLLLTQSYITEVSRIEDEGLPAGFVNLDMFRHTPGLGKIHIVNAHLRAFGFPDYDFSKGGWLEGFQYIRLPSKSYAIMNVTGRYEDTFHNWYREIKWLRKYVRTHVYFIGNQSEYLAMQYECTYWPVRDFLEATYVIAKAKYFSGCQSAILAIRQGLGLPYRMMQSPHHSDCNQYSPIETIINKRSRKAHLLVSTLKNILS